MALSVPVDLIDQHLAALWTSDGAGLEGTLSSQPQLVISCGDQVHADWDIGGFYRFLTQAWDFTPQRIEREEASAGVVRVKMLLTKNAAWAKTVQGAYRVIDDHIGAIHMTDQLAFPSADFQG